MSAVADLRGRLGALSPRERAMAALLAAVVASAGAAGALDQARTAQEAAVDAREVEASMTRLTQARGATPFRLAVAQEAGRARAWSLAEPTVYIARVRARSDLEAMARAAGISNLRVRVAEVRSAAAPVQPLALTVEGDFDWISFLTLLSLTAEADQSLTPTAVEVTPAPPGEVASGDAMIAPQPRFRMEVQVPYLAGGPT